MVTGKNQIEECDRIAEIVPYIYGESSPAERYDFEAHLPECVPCTDELAAIAEARFAVYEWNREEFSSIPTPAFVIPYENTPLIGESFASKLTKIFGLPRFPAWGSAAAAVRSRTDSWHRVKAFASDHPALAFFADERFQPLFTEVPVFEFFATRLVPGAKALATLDDDGSNALLVERAYDRGRVFLWTTSIDPAWTRLPQSPATLVPFVHELLRYARSSDAAPRNLGLGTPLAAEVAAFPRAISLVRPDGTKKPIDGEAQSLAGNRWKLPVVSGRDVESSGLYRLETEGAGTLAFALEIDPFEGDLDRLSLDRLDLGGIRRVGFRPRFDRFRRGDRFPREVSIVDRRKSAFDCHKYRS